MRPLLCALILFSFPAFAVDIKSLGKPLDDDTKPMLNRYVYFNIEATGKDVPLERAILSNADIEEWLRQHITDALTLTGATYDQKIVALKPYFTPAGYGAYIASLEQAALPSLLKEKAYGLSAVVMDRPDIAGQGLRDTTPEAPKENKIYQYVWQVKVPALLSYTHGTESVSYNVTIETEVTRVPVTEDGVKVAINGWRFAETKQVEKPKDKPAESAPTAALAPSSSRFAF